MAVTQIDEPELTRAQRFASLTSSGHIHAFYPWPALPSSAPTS